MAWIMPGDWKGGRGGVNQRLTPQMGDDARWTPQIQDVLVDFGRGSWGHMTMLLDCGLVGGKCWGQRLFGAKPYIEDVVHFFYLLVTLKCVDTRFFSVDCVKAMKRCRHSPQVKTTLKLAGVHW